MPNKTDDAEPTETSHQESALDLNEVARLYAMLTPEQKATLTPEQKEKPTTVVQALARVMRDIPGIGRNDLSEQGYKYRGIEAITAEAQKLLGKYGVVFSPRVLSREVVHLTINNRPWTQDEAMIVYTVYGPSHGLVRERLQLIDGAPVLLSEIIDDSIEVGPFVALGRDNSDKGMNKAMTQAFKYAMLQVLCIGDSASDADREKAAEADEKPRELTPEEQAARRLEEARHLLGQAIRALSPAGRSAVRGFCDDRKLSRTPSGWSDDDMASIEEFLDSLPPELAVPAEAPAEGAEKPAEPPAPALPFDPAVLPAERSKEADLRWLTASPEGMATAHIARVKALPDEEVKAESEALGIDPLARKSDERRAQLVARLVRVDMEQMAGIEAPAPAEPPAEVEQEQTAE